MKQSNQKPKASPQARVRAAFTLYPWMKPQFEDLDIKNVHFHKVSHAVLEQSAYPHHEMFKEFNHDLRIYLYTEEGRMIDHVGRIGRDLSGSSETVEVALVRVKNKGEVAHFIVGALRDEESPWSLHIASPPAGLTLEQALEDEQKLALEELKKEI